MPTIGKKAPAFTLLDQDGTRVKKKLYGRTDEGVIRSHFVIDPAGKLVDQHIKVSPKDSVARALAFLQGDA